MREFWKSAGLHLVDKSQDGWLNVTEDYLRAYYTRPEIHPIEDSCKQEHALFEKLMADPFSEIRIQDLTEIKDEEAAYNYQVILKFRDHLAQHGTLEAAYSALFQASAITTPPVFIDQMAHLILRNILADEVDPYILRAAELFYREQVVTTGDGQLMLADHEIVEMYTENGGFGGLGQLLNEAGTPTREVTLDILSDTNKDQYWERSDQFDMAIDFRFTEPASDALGRVIEKWVRHFHGVETRVQAVQSIQDEKWAWHIGLDAQANSILNALYEGVNLSEEELHQIIALYRMEFLNPEEIEENLVGKPIYLGLAMGQDNHFKMKPQNLLTNMPLRRG
ncbi:MAG: hypothetical protein JKX94_10255 [Sneathiella sp.]|nr:hypothetical protein [Sneathiella sp.]